MSVAPSLLVKSFDLPATQHWIHPRQRWVVVLLFSLATITSFHLGTQFAILLGVGKVVAGAIVQFDVRGGLLVGSLIGVAQWIALRSARFPKAWIAVTAASWAIAAGVNASLNSSLASSEIDLVAKSVGFHPFTFWVLASGQWWVLQQRVRVGWQWLLLPLVQLLWVIVMLAIVQITMFSVFILSLIHFSQQPFWLTISGLRWIGTIAYHLLILVHSTLPAMAFCLVKRSQSS